MRLLLFSDVHADESAARQLVAKARGVDLVVGAGDFGTARRNIGRAIDVLAAIDRPAVLVPGNNESFEELVAACSGWKTARVLHGTGITLEGQAFFGIGGGIPVTPFGPWSYDFSEEDAAHLLAPLPPNAILVSHSPPRGAVDRDSGGRTLGSMAVRDAVISRQPRLAVCGHIHACGGEQAWLGRTLVVNAGPAGMFWDSDNQVSAPSVPMSGQ